MITQREFRELTTLRTTALTFRQALAALVRGLTVTIVPGGVNPIRLDETGGFERHYPGAGWTRMSNVHDVFVPGGNFYLWTEPDPNPHEMGTFDWAALEFARGAQVKRAAHAEYQRYVRSDSRPTFEAFMFAPADFRARDWCIVTTEKAAAAHE